MAASIVVPVLGELSAFHIGFGSSICVEIGAALKATSLIQGKCPEQYKRPFYLFIRFAMALVAGAIPVALNAADVVTAMYMGASAPLILDRVGRGLDPLDQSKSE